MAYFYFELQDTREGYIKSPSKEIAMDYLEYLMPESPWVTVEYFDYNKHGRLDDYNEY